ncbi:hypothetical protein Taro_027783 [Colocasia esculenta]|uniref:Fungal lipase-type domain-containing protein n=1 Tax=Colocasia esculenta TaxID=4460 RepID=A0A843VVB2_COLES|nr:hypothetical protein [Colocasia esculenta]
MHAGATVTATPRHVSPMKSTAPVGRSPLGSGRTRAAAAAPTITNAPPSIATAANNTSAHIANLERLLKRPSPPPNPPPPPLHHVERREEEDAHRGSERRGGFHVNGLNLSGIVPTTKNVEDMSPRTLGMIQRLITGTPRPSPRSGIARRWRDLHGAKDWSGLLEPLDQDLRREIIRYGEFVQVAYHAFHSDAAKRPSDPRHVALPDRSYRVTRGLYATSSIEAPRWVDGMAPWMRQRSSWIGFVAVCDSDREIQRMGRRDIVIALRGTATALEWAENFRANLVSVSENSADGGKVEASGEPKVECGFWSLFTTGSKRAPSLCDMVVEEVQRLMKVYKGEQLSITVTGHSLGAALAVLVADELRVRSGGPDAPPVAVFSFGGPHVGNRAFAERVRTRGVKVLRVVNERDVITKVPGVFAGQQKVAEEEREREKEKEEDSRREVIRQRWRRAAAEGKRVRLTDRWWDTVERAMRAWGYAHVGSELRVDSRQSPYLKPDADPGCCHDLEAYLHLVDGFLSSTCPFRANAKRSIAKLVTQQGSNIKKHYTSNALAALGMEHAASLDAALRDSCNGCLPSPSSS